MADQRMSNTETLMEQFGRLKKHLVGRLQELEDHLKAGTEPAQRELQGVLDEMARLECNIGNLFGFDRNSEETRRELRAVRNDIEAFILDLLQDSDLSVGDHEKLAARADSVPVTLAVRESIQVGLRRTYDVLIPSVILDDDSLHERLLDHLQDSDSLWSDRFEVHPEPDFCDSDGLTVEVERKCP
jgi:hypothetical protein